MGMRSGEGRRNEEALEGRVVGGRTELSLGRRPTKTMKWARDDSESWNPLHWAEMCDLPGKERANQTSVEAD